MTIHVAPPVSPEACPALVLNADYRPLSYYPLSLWCWQDAIKAVFLERVNIVSEYDRRGALAELRDAPAIGRFAQELCEAAAPPGLHALQRVLAGPFHLPILRRPGGSDLRPCGAALERRTDDLGECGHRVRAVQSSERATGCPPKSGMWPAPEAVSADGASSSTTTAGCSRRTICTKAGWIIFTGIPSSSRKPARETPPRHENGCEDMRKAAFSARMRIMSTAALASEKASAYQGSPKTSGRTPISPATTT